MCATLIGTTLILSTFAACLHQSTPRSQAVQVLASYTRHRDVPEPATTTTTAPPHRSPAVAMTWPPAPKKTVARRGCRSLEQIKRDESGGSYSEVNPSSGAGGAYQFLPSTWRANGGQGLPQNASPAEQDRVAQKVYAEQGSRPWAASGC